MYVQYIHTIPSPWRPAASGRDCARGREVSLTEAPAQKTHPGDGETGQDQHEDGEGCGCVDEERSR